MDIFLGLDLHLNVKKKQDLKVAAGALCRPLPLKRRLGVSALNPSFPGFNSCKAFEQVSISHRKLPHAVFF